jgi:hypothetical protein
MDVGSLSTAMTMSAVGSQVDVGVLKAVQNLDQAVAAELFSSIGLGGSVDALA